jgi:hypothetical protein
MKALSFRQPWAELIVQGRKTMDLRTYRTNHRGPLAIHASKKVERDACREHGLNPDDLDTGGVVGVVELVDVIPLTKFDYEAHRDEHLVGRNFREPMFGWVLVKPQRLPRMVPARGRMSLFNVDLEIETPLQDRQPALSLQMPTRAPGRRGGVYQTDAGSNDREKPFTLYVKPLNGASTSYALTLAQRIVEPDLDQLPSDRRVRAGMTTIVSLNGDNLKAVADHIIEALRQGGYKATDLSPERTQPFYLPEAVGVRLGLVLLTVKPLSKLKRVEAISYGIRQMPLEEVYYWYSKCTATDTAERAQKALRVLLAAE